MFEGTTIRARLTMALVVLLLLWGAASVAMLCELSRIHERAERIVLEHLPRLKRANALVDRANETARLMGEMQLATGRGPVRARIDSVLAIRAQAAEEMGRLDADSRHDGTGPLLVGIVELRHRYWAAQDRLFALLEQDPAAARAYYLGDVIGMQRQYVQAIAALIRLEDERASVAAARTRVEYERALYFLLAVSGLALLLAGSVGFLVLRSITVPLEAAAMVARNVAQGNLDVDLVERRRDEIGQLASALRWMAESLRLDRSRRQATERALRESQAQLRELAAYAESLREQERLTLARELHDEFGQSITAVRMELGMLRMRFGHLDPALAPQVAHIKCIVDAMLRTMRDAVAMLRPGALDEGLVPAAEWLLATLSGRAGFTCTLEARQGDLPLGQDVRTAAFRILQEAMTNVVRHAHARTVRVSIALDDGGMLMLEVADDGVGIDVAAGGAHTFGIFGMRERALSFGGSLEFEETAGGGTTLRAMLDTAGGNGAMAGHDVQSQPCGRCGCGGRRVAVRRDSVSCGRASGECANT